MTDSDHDQRLERERRLALPAGLLTLLAVVLYVGGQIIAANALGTGEITDNLREIDSSPGGFIAGNIVRGIGLGLLVAPLLYLFRAAATRSPAVRRQLIGVVIAAPLFLAAAAVLRALADVDAASDFVAMDPGGMGDTATDLAEEKFTDASLRPLANGLELGGRLGFAIAMTYICFHAMKAGLLSRFWGSLGMALGVVSFLVFGFTALWFIYLGLLIAGRVPGGRPPAWAAGEAITWPTPGERAAESLAPGSTDDGDSHSDSDTEDDGLGSDGGSRSPNPSRQPGQRRKRKRRS